MSKAHADLEAAKQEHLKWKLWVEGQHSQAIQGIHDYYANNLKGSTEHEDQMLDQILQSEKETKRLQGVVSDMVSLSMF